MLVLLLTPLHARRRIEYVNPSEIEVTIEPLQKEIFAGDVASFTIRVRNRTDKPVSLDFDTGQQFDLAGFSQKVQIFRWSQGLRWNPAPHSIRVHPGRDFKTTLGWQTIDRNGYPLPQGVYRAKGILKIAPRNIVSNTTSFRLLPPEIKKTQKIKAQLRHLFSIEVPRYKNGKELKYQIYYISNRNRISLHSSRYEGDLAVFTFYPKRVGRASFHMYSRIDTSDFTSSLARRTYEVVIEEKP